MSKGKMMALVATGALVALLALVGCGGSQSSAAISASASAASSSAAASSASAAASSAAASSASAAASSAAASSASAAAASTAAASSPAASAGYIGEEAAKAIALSDAGVAEADCTELKVGLDTDDGTVHYDVDFKAGGMEYDYDIDPTTGAILKANSEVDD